MRKSPTLDTETNTVKMVDVLFYFDSVQQYARPVRLTFEGQEYELGGVQFWYSTRHNGRLTHHYTVGDTKRQHTFQLAFDTEALTWVLEQDAEQDEPAPVRYTFNRLVGAMG